MSFRLPYFGFFDAVNTGRPTANSRSGVHKAESVAASSEYKLSRANSDVLPSLLILERSDAYEIHIRVPGVMSQDHIDIALHRDMNDAVLSIVVPAINTDENTDAWTTGEPTNPEFRRTIRLPTKVGTGLGQVTATYDDEVLTLKFQKLEVSPNTVAVHRIRIDASSQTR
ncbi:AFR633Wp [Eremothecium gossypii ATCC 10895]|uniref:AFR633Wp n=1 Tax=Eremothecium gossypii (strain ATCC 10895 / CBS 109.51 / FGSC 9923 / NRRL Y-1056) TaxID=284811 RepID=Q752E3_EREGS|nr:AFR633Wp [Eremothecium gossypii ATCC 10895]AAS54004.1 AFR633Wp [Eremothecium gossypii ATCC 10895]AEY98318.1 FAFR633Wp [Eremothecium gossypii FDAG1]